MLRIERLTLALSFIALLPLGCGGEVATGGVGGAGTTAATARPA